MCLLHPPSSGMKSLHSSGKKKHCQNDQKIAYLSRANKNSQHLVLHSKKTSVPLHAIQILVLHCQNLNDDKELINLFRNQIRLAYLLETHPSDLLMQRTCRPLRVVIGKMLQIGPNFFSINYLLLRPLNGHRRILYLLSKFS